jgi:hypothetical protein
VGQRIRINGDLSSEHSAKGKLQRACLDLLREHEQRGELPTSVRFLFYELVQRKLLAKHAKPGQTRKPENYFRKR